MPSQSASHERPVFERGLAIARRNIGLLLICAITVPVVALAYSLVQTPKYTASAELLFSSQNIDAQLFGITTDTDPQREAATNLKLLSVDQVATRTAKALDLTGLSPGVVSDEVAIAPEGESDLVSVEATDADPAVATLIANEFAKQYISFSRETEQAKVRRAQTLVQTTYDNLPPREQAGQTGQDLQQQIRQLETLAAVQTGNAELAQQAIEPTSPSSPKTNRNVALGVVLGLMLGIGLALLREQFDRRLRDTADIEELFGVPLLGEIPESRAIRQSGPGAAIPPAGVEGEAFRMLRANLRYFNVDRQITSILITSAAAQDGKTTVSWNLARSEAHAGQRVLFIEADLRRPSLAHQVGVSGEHGLSLVLAGADERNEAIISVGGVDVLPAGPPPPNPAELIESQRMNDLLAWATDEYDRVVIDTPPSAVVADAVPLFNQVGGVVLVTRLGQSPREAAEHLHEQIVHTDAPVLGLVVNGVDAPPDSDYYRSSSAMPMADGSQFERKVDERETGSKEGS